MRLAAILSILCFIAPHAQADGKFLALSDVHFGQDVQGNQWGHKRETSPTLWSYAQTEAEHLRDTETPDFIIYLGDMPAHDEDKSARGDEFTAVLDGLAKIAGASTPLYFLPGNNDTLQPDYCAFSDGLASTPFTKDSKYDHTDPAGSANSWPALNAYDTIIDDTHIARGYYSAYPVPGQTALRLIALNTVMFTNYYGVSFSNGCSPNVTSDETSSRVNAQIEWFAAQLADAKTKGERVLVAMHVPPGMDGYSGGPNWAVDTRKQPTRGYFNATYSGSDPALVNINANGGATLDAAMIALVTEHKDRITGLLTAHTHLDDLRIVQDCAGDFVNLAIGVPAITTDHSNYPAMKMFSYDAGFDLTEAITHYADIDTGHNWSAGNTYGFMETYCATDSACAGKALKEVVISLEQSDPDRLYRQMHKRLAAGGPPPRDHSYKASLIARPPACP